MLPPPRFVQYKATSLEKQHKHDLLTEPDLGVTIDLINPDTYRIDPSVLLDPADEKLLEEEIQAPTSSKRSQQHAKVVPWMRKTEYISTEFNRYGVSNEKPEVKIGVSVKQQFTEEEIYKDRDSQIAAIEKTFEDAQKRGRGWECGFLPPPPRGRSQLGGHVLRPLVGRRRPSRSIGAGGSRRGAAAASQTLL
ncbi:PREDICTED: RNA polymerase II-associated factor 1 homolog [Haliaeetus leucocephalus]|uniref:RNA polymerase II-associated factor 1 homolog n=1 Tax=Haliaeetus leucocephalus TaxID=52644 RepID=UPI00053CAAAF|nr:PREDICTED: RNA polymerase II-associated factor 1 homolog [Haliaeetus leucocephalus]